jgi:acyl-CoA reductase-like NAD-dependent aldehyde dehydrogenase
MKNNEAEVKQTVSALMKRSRAAMQIIEGYSQERVDKLAAAIAYKLSRTEVALELAELAYQETGMGNVESKTAKLTKKIPGCFYDVIGKRTVGVIDYDEATGITKIGKPLGVIGALIPSTNPEATPVFKGMLALRGRNTIVFGPHPASTRTTQEVVRIMRTVMRDNNAPEDVFICIENPSKLASQEIMSQCDVVMATGSRDMVTAAYSSGRPAYGVGAGNAVIVVDETVDLAETARMIRVGKTGDNASGCSAENSLVVQEGIYDGLINELRNVGAYVCDADDKQRLQKAMWSEGRLRREVVAQEVGTIANEAGIEIPEGTAFLLVEESEVGPEAPFSGEKLSLVLTIYKYSGFDEAVNLVNDITGFSGAGHSCGIHRPGDQDEPGDCSPAARCSEQRELVQRAGVHLLARMRIVGRKLGIGERLAGALHQRHPNRRAD